MHMSDALVSTAVGGTMLIATAGIAAYSVRKLKQDDEMERKIPIMGVVGAFVFAAQMINFAIPGTGSSGHIGGGLLLASVLGPWGGFLTMAAILLVQALFFGDGGLLAYGCNVINMGFFGCIVGYNIIFKAIVSKGYNKKRIFIGSIVGVVVSLQLGAASVVVETLFSGITELPFKTFIIFMQPIHLAIGLVEGLITALVLSFVYDNRPEIIADVNNVSNKMSFKKLISIFMILALVVGGTISIFASGNPDGLEWSIGKTYGSEELENKESVHKALANIQEKTSFLPDYSFKSDNPTEFLEKAGTIVSGVIGVFITLGVAIVIGKSVKKKHSNKVKA